FLPTEQARRVGIGAQARSIPDARPPYVVPARFAFVSDGHRFTPNEADTARDRRTLTISLRPKIANDLLEHLLAHVKPGLPGVAHVKLDPQAEWPPQLQIRLPDEPA